jgi:Ca2+-binding RTX toxin-like protein
MPKGPLIAAVAAATCLLAPAGASAATIAKSGGVVTYTAAPGERNLILLSQSSGNTVVQDDGGNPLTSDGSCTVAGSVANCGVATGVQLLLGDRDDSLALSTAPLSAATAIRVDAGPGNDTLTDQPGPDTYLGGPGNDSFVNGAPDGYPDAFAGGDGRDSVSYFGSADVRITADGVADDGTAGEGDNVGTDVEDLFGGDGDDVIVGTDAANTLVGGAGNDFIEGRGGDDNLAGGDGDDTMRGGAGADAVSGDAGDDALYGEAGGDTLAGGAGADALYGGDDGDLLSGGDGADALTGEGGDDTLSGGQGADAMSGGAGSDTVTYEGLDVPVRVTLDGAADDGAAGEGDNAQADVENIVGSDKNDVLSGSAAANSITGGPGNDTIDVRDHGPDEVSCGTGLDSVVADASDAIDPSAGTCEAVDLGRVAGLGRRVTLAAGSGRVTGARATLRLRCPLDAMGGCAGAVTLSARGLGRIGRASFQAPAGGTVTVRVRLAKKALRRLPAPRGGHRPRRLRTTVGIVARDARAPLGVVAAQLALRG